MNLMARRSLLLLPLCILSAVVFFSLEKRIISVWNRNFADEFSKYAGFGHEPSSMLSHLSYSGDNYFNVSELLSGHLVPNIVFYVWCGSRSFEFGHYLSVLSVVRHIRPDKIIFYYNKYPQIDGSLYNTWFLELLESFPYFITKEIGFGDACKSETQAKKAYIELVVGEKGGIYINELTILNSFPFSCRRSNEKTFYNSDGSLSGFISKSKNKKSPSSQNIESQSQSTICEMTCINSRDAKNVTHDKSMPCVHLIKPIYPKDIWTLENSFGRIARTLFYGTPEIRQAKSSNKTLAPNIAHMIWMGGGSMDFLFYLSVLSLIYVAKVDMLYIHGDLPPRGEYWDLVKNVTKLKLVYRSSSTMIYGNNVRKRAHKSDVWRVDIMMKYGGLYIDTDALFVKPLDREIRSYDAVASYDWPHEHPFPNVINLGVTVGKRNAPFWRKFQSSMQWFIDGDWSWNGVRQPYRVFERNPELLKIDPRLQVICHMEKCHPTWYPDYSNVNIHHLNSPSIKNWRNDTHAFHWTYPNPWELRNPKKLFRIITDTMFSQMGKFILKEAGMFEYFQKKALA